MIRSARCGSRARRPWRPPSRPTAARRPAPMPRPMSAAGSASSPRNIRSSDPMVKEPKKRAFDSSAGIAEVLGSAGYLADEGLATAVQLATALKKPLLLEGEPGVGKTEIARALATAQQRDLIRLQCYEGIDAA